MSDDVMGDPPESLNQAVGNAFAKLFEHIHPHREHPWHKVGRCVFCGPCHVRLFQGDVPPEHPIYKPPRQRTPADDMRARWGMESRPEVHNQHGGAS